ncbi:hypothetical protein ACIQU6_12325 [Streptomyces sp. NPDC090442]|uniref:hypothetical protein n=1 Tax=Streptomyces sp. NPDC090442 TaxID=3365962 RepID=UPI0038283107
MPVEQHSDPFEDRLSAALHQVGGTFDTNQGALAAAGAAHGRRLRLRRCAVLVSGAAGIVLAGVSGTLLLSWSGTPAGSRTSSAAAGQRTATPSAASSPSAVGKDEMIRTWEALLRKTGSGAAVFRQEEGRGTREGEGGWPYASVVYDDGKGPAALSVSLARVEPGGQEARQRTRCPDRTLARYDACSTERLADGSELMILQGYEYADGRADTKRWTANLVTPAGQSVSLSEWNAAEKGAPVSRAEPPLSAGQLRTLAAAQEWRRITDTLPGGPRQRAERPAAPPLSAKLSALLPKGLDVAKKSDGGDAEYGYVVVDDGKGRSLLQVNVQPDMREVAGDLFRAGSETLADGTRVAVHQGPGNDRADGVVRWTVDTMRPDGKRVVVSAFNAETQYGAATRTTPALTMHQLRVIALNPQWWEGS